MKKSILTVVGKMKKLDVFLLITLALFCFSGTAYAKWQIQYTGKAARMFGSAPRGNFATKKQCLDYRKSRPAFERNNSKCVGCDEQNSSRTQQGRRSRVSQDNNIRQMKLREEAKHQQMIRQMKLREEAKHQQMIRQQKDEQKKEEARVEFEQGKKEMLMQFKGGSGGGILSLKGSGETLALKPGNVPSPNQGAGKTGKVKTGGKDPEAKKEQFEFENFNDDWMVKQKQLIAQRLKKPNKWCSGIHASLMGKVPPLPYKKFNELEAGDVLLFDDGLIPISVIDNYFSGDKVSNVSHTVSYLKEVNGKKLFLDNQPGKGPRIISEDVFLKKYGSRSAEVARLVGQPVSNEETKKLFTAAVKMAQKNRNAGGTNYGVWGKDDMVCSEASWALLKATGRKIPKSDDQIKVAGGIGFSPADFQDSRYFLVTPVYISK